MSNKGSARWVAAWVGGGFGVGAAIGVALGALRFLGDPVAIALSSIGGALFFAVLLPVLYWNLHPSAVLVSDFEVRVRRLTGERTLQRSEFRELLIAVPPKEAEKPPDARVYGVTVVRTNGRQFRVGIVTAEIVRRLMAASPEPSGTLITKRGRPPPDRI